MYIRYVLGLSAWRVSNYYNSEYYHDNRSALVCSRIHVSIDNSMYGWLVMETQMDYDLPFILIAMECEA